MNRTERYFSNGELVSTNQRDVTWDEVRANRDQALKESDWRAGKDVVLSTAWKDYRQALRDLPQDHAESNDAVDNWPVAPDE